jgi:hypothetical protein
LLWFVLTLILLMGTIVGGIFLIRHKRTFLRWFSLLFCLLFFGLMSGIYGSFYFLSTSNENGCITKDCAWFD